MKKLAFLCLALCAFTAHAAATNTGTFLGEGWKETQIKNNIKEGEVFKARFTGGNVQGSVSIEKYIAEKAERPYNPWLLKSFDFPRIDGLLRAMMRTDNMYFSRVESYLYPVLKAGEIEYVCYGAKTLSNLKEDKSYAMVGILYCVKPGTKETSQIVVSYTMPFGGTDRQKALYQELSNRYYKENLSKNLAACVNGGSLDGFIP